MNTYIKPFIDIVAEYYGVKPENLYSRCPHRGLKEPRYVTWWLISELTGATITTLGHMYNQRSSGTIRYGLDQLPDWRQNRPDLDERCIILLDKCRAAIEIKPVPKSMLVSKRNISVRKPKSERNHVRASRRCLMCTNDFMSEHIGERVCPRCKDTTVWRSGAAA